MQVLVAVAAGIIVGWLAPDQGKYLKPLGDGFVKLVKMLISPIVFCTIVLGLGSVGDMRKLGRVGLRTLVYFEIVSTLALMVGLIVVNSLRPGEGFNVDVAQLAPEATRDFARSAQSLSGVGFALNIIPKTIFEAFVGGDLLQVLLVALLTSLALAGMGTPSAPLIRGLELLSTMLFRILAIVVRLAPLGAFGAMAFTVSSYGLGSLHRLLALMAGFYVTSGFFVFVILGGIAWACGFSLFRFLVFIKEELLLVLGTSSSETAMPGMITKLQALGCQKSTVGLVIPTGYSFNLDGTNIYMAMAAVFLAQATNTPLSVGQQLTFLGVAMLTSKGASGVTGAGFVTLAATLAAMPGIPVEAMALLLGVDRFMSECRAITNLIGNGVATLVISLWEKDVTSAALRASLGPLQKSIQSEFNHG